MKKKIYFVLSVLLFAGMAAFAQVTTFPYTEGFEGGALPSGWTTENVGNYGWEIVEQNSYTGGNQDLEYPQQGNHMATAYIPTYDGETRLISPYFNFSSVTESTLNLTFWMGNPAWGSDINDWIVEYQVEGSTDWLPLLTMTDESYATWTKKTVDLLPLVTLGNVRLAFHVSSDWGYASCLDNLQISTLFCPDVTGLALENATSSSLTFSWDAVEGHTTFDIRYKEETDTVWTEVSGSSPYTLSGLEISTLYHVNVRAVCTPAGDWGTTLAFRTLAQEQIPATVPYTCDFEDATQNSAWTLSNGGQTNQWFIDTAVNNTEGGTKALYVSNSAGTSNTYNNGIVSYVYAYRTLDLNQGIYTVAFDWKSQGETSWDVMQAFLTPATADLSPGTANGMNGNNNTAPAGWISLGGYKSGNGTAWTSENIELTVSTDANYNLAFFWKNDGSGGVDPAAAIDNISINQISCPAPGNLQADNITTTEATIYWVPALGSTSQTYEVRYGAMGTPVEEMTLSLTATDTLAQLSGLAPNSYYDIYVRAICTDPSDIYWGSGKLTIHTGCAPFTLADIPYTENFDNSMYASGDTPDCWAGYASSESNYPEISQLASRSHSLPNVYSFPVISTSSPDTVYAILPPFDETVDLSNLMLSFYAYKLLANNEIHLEVGVASVLDPSAFVLVQSITIDAVRVWELKEILLNGITGSPHYIVIRSYGASVMLDDVTVQEIPSCMEPDNLTVSQIESSSVQLAWTERGDATAWEVAYGPAGFTMGDGTETVLTASTNPYTLSGLEEATHYDVYVRAVCAADDQSDYSDVRDFFTTRVPATIPYICDFEDAEVNAEWEFRNGSETNQWYIDTAVNNTPDGTKSLYISQDGGVTHTYKIATGVGSPVDSWVYAFRTLQFDPGVYTIRFDWMAQGESSYYDYLDAFLAPTPLQLFPGEASNTTPGLIHFSNLSGEHLYGSSAWTTFATELTVTEATTYNLVFYWYNDGSVGSNPPAAVDNISITPLTCSAPGNFQASNVTATEATIHWDPVPGASSNTFELRYGLAGTLPGDMTNMATVTDTLYSLSNLLPNTYYDVYVRSVCDDPDDIDWGMEFLHFTTNCEGLTADDLPYTQDFESAATGSAPATSFVDCWRRYDDYSDGSNYPYVYDYSYYAHSGNNSLYFDGTPNTLEYAVLPPLDASLPTNSTMISFWMRSSNTSAGIDVCLAMDYADVNTYQTIATIRPSAADSYEHFEILFNEVQGTDPYFIVLKYASTGYFHVCVDDVLFQLIPDCVAPDNVAVSNVAATSATISWNERGGATEWVLEYGDPGFTPGTGTMVIAATNPYTLAGLIPGTSYEIYVRSLCAGVDSSDYGASANFYATCLPLSLPYTENFDSYTGTGYTIEGTIPDCWHTYTNNTVYPAPHVGSGSYIWASSTPNALTFTAGSDGNQAFAIFPAFTAPVNTLQISFNAAVENIYNGVLSIGYLTGGQTDVSTYISIDTMVLTTGAASSGTAAILPFTVDFSQWNVPETATHVAFLWLCNTSYYNASVDDIQVTTTMEPCLMPSDLQVDNIASATATASWTAGGDETAWNVEYKKVSESNYTVIPVTATTYDFVGLDAETDYDVRVQAVCGTDNVSEYLSATFTTDTTPVTRYTIVASANEFGTISPSGDVYVNEGDDQLFVFSAEVDYAVRTVLVDDVELDPSEYADNRYTFTNVTANHTIRVEFALGIEDWTQGTIRVYPNPVDEELVVDFGTATFQTGDVIALYNQYGALVGTFAPTGSQTKLFVGNLAPGVYLLRTGSHNLKFVKL